MWSPRVLAEFSTTNLLLDRINVFVFEQLGGDLCTDAERFLERRAGGSHHLEDEMAFAEFREKFATEERGDARGGEDAKDNNGGDNGTRPAGYESEDFLVAVL